jgi:hypothetical protein
MISWTQALTAPKVGGELARSVLFEYGIHSALSQGAQQEVGISEQYVAALEHVA